MIRSKSRHNFVSKMNHDNIPKQAKSILLGLNVNYDDLDKEKLEKERQEKEAEERRLQQEEAERNRVLDEEEARKKRLADELEAEKRREAERVKEKLSELSSRIEKRKDKSTKGNNDKKDAPLGLGNSDTREQYQSLVDHKVRKITAINELKVKLSQRIANRTEPVHGSQLIDDTASVVSLHSASSFHDDAGDYTSFGNEDFAHSYHEFAKIEEEDDDDAWDLMGKDAYHTSAGGMMNDDDDDNFMGRTLQRTSVITNDDDDEEEVVQYKSFMLNDKNLKDSLTSAISDMKNKNNGNSLENTRNSFYNNNNNSSSSRSLRDLAITEEDGRIGKPDMSLTAGYSFYKSTHSIKERTVKDDQASAKFLVVSELAPPTNSPTTIKSDNLEIKSPTKRQGPQLVTKLSFVQVLDTAVTLATVGRGKKMIPPDPIPWQPIKKKELFPDYNPDDHKKPAENIDEERIMNKSFSVHEYKEMLKLKQKQQDEEDKQLPFLTLSSMAEQGHELDKLVPNKVTGQSFRRPPQLDLSNNNANTTSKSPMSKTGTASHVGDFLTRTLSKAASMFTLPNLTLANEEDLQHKTLTKGQYASFTTTPSLAKSPVNRSVNTNDESGLKVKFSERHLKSMKDTEIGKTAPVIYAPQSARSMASEATMVSDLSMMDIKMGAKTPNLLKKSSFSSKSFHINASENMSPVSASAHNQLDLSSESHDDLKMRQLAARNKLANKLHSRYQLDKEVEHFKATAAEERMARIAIEESEIMSEYDSELRDWIIGDHHRPHNIR